MPVFITFQNELKLRGEDVSGKGAKVFQVRRDGYTWSLR